MLPIIFEAAADAAKRHAEIEYPKESVGIVALDGEYVPLVNVHAQPEKSFAISDEDALKYHGEMAAVIHSHCLVGAEIDPLDGPLAAGPSSADLIQQGEMGCPWGIVTVIDGRSHETVLWWGDTLPTPIPPLIGRPFIHGIFDCYSIIRDAYRGDEFGFVKEQFGQDSILLAEQPRDFDWWEKKTENGKSIAPQNLYMENFERVGFRQISLSEVRPGDVFLAQIGASVTNHGGLILANDLIAHHLRRRLSKREPGSRWAEYMTTFLRYEG